MIDGAVDVNVCVFVAARVFPAVPVAATAKNRPPPSPGGNNHRSERVLNTNTQTHASGWFRVRCRAKPTAGVRARVRLCTDVHADRLPVLVRLELTQPRRSTPTD